MYVFLFCVLESYKIYVEVTPTQFGKILIPVLFTFQRLRATHKILREILYQCVPDAEVFAEIQPIAPYVKPEVKPPEELDIVRSDVKAKTGFVTV